MANNKGYRFAVQWIADNDEPGILEPEDVMYMISVLLVADLFGKSNEDVARAVVRCRQKAASEK